MKRFKKYFEKQRDEADCGVACLSMIINFHGGSATIESLRNRSGTSIDGTTLLGMIQAANSVGLVSEAFEATLNDLDKLTSPVILHVVKNERYEHYITLFCKHGSGYIIGDPEEGVMVVSRDYLNGAWRSGALLTFEQSSGFKKNNQIRQNKFDFLKLIVANYQSLILSSISMGLLVASLNLSTTIFIEKLIDVLIPNGNTSKILLALVSWLLILLFRSALSMYRDNILTRLSYNIQSSIIGIFLNRLLYQPKSFFDGRTSGDLSARLNDTEKMQGSLNDFFGQTVIDILTLICSIVLVWIYHSTLGMFILGLIPVYFIIVYSFQAEIYKANLRVMVFYGNAEADYLDSISGISTIKVNNREAFFQHRVTQKFGKYLTGQENIGYSIASFRTLNDVFGILALGFVLLFSVNQVFDGTMQIGDMVAVMGVIGISLAATTRIALSTTRLQESRAAFERAYEVISLDHEYTLSMEDEYSNTEFDHINVIDVSFGFPGRDNLLDEINIEIRKGSISLLFGQIGAGKSTFLQLLQKFYIPNSGEILINGINLNEIRTDVWRGRIGVVPQSIKVFNDTVAFNICLSTDETELNRVENFCFKYGFDSIFSELPQHYQTYLGESGVKLSGGQQQILGIARALFKQPSFLLLDEPTSSMDDKTEGLILSLLKALKMDMGILIVTHKKRTELIADRIFDLRQGTVYEPSLK